MVTQVSLNSGAIASAGTLKLQTNGTTDAVHIDASQNVGVGTASPSAKLDVAGSVNVTGNTTLGDASTDTVTVNGYIGVSASPSSDTGIYLRSNYLTGTSQTGIQGSPVINSSATATSHGVYGSVSTAAAAFTASSVRALGAGTITKGAGSTITDAHGLYIYDQTQGTNNYGITSAVSSGTNKWNIYASGTAQNYFAGNVGIGVSAPAYKLHVQSATPVVSIQDTTSAAGGVGGTLNFVAYTSGTSGANVEAQIKGVKSSASPAGELQFFTSDSVGTSTQRAIIDGAGNLGLGVTPSAWGAAYKAYQNTAFVSLYSVNNATGGLANNAYNNGTSWIYAGTAGAGLYNQNLGQHQWYTAPSGTAGTAITFTQAMTLDASGNLLVGATSAAFGNGSGFIVQRAGTATVRINDSTDVNALELTADATGALISARGNFPIRFDQSGTERMRIDSSGNVLVTGAGGLGYGTGSGGAVTQATSRTTGVTINKTNGAITLVSAAGSTTFQSFTVTNSTVAATDVIRVVQKSGTDKYAIWVTNVAAGSFQITFATLSGTTTEQPVFNFAVIKAVTA